MAIPRAALKLPQPSPLQLAPIQWYVITADNAAQVFAQIKKSGEQPVVFALTAGGYQSLSGNQLLIRQYMQLQQQQLTSYRQYYEAPDATK